MTERELRLATVCYGGVSLAIYMHGITKEFLKLARASKTYHGINDFAARAEAAYPAAATSRADAVDTETVYFELLKRIGQAIDLRVVIDIVSGASAGGVNGAALARALAHDLDMDTVTDAWMVEGDVERLLAEDGMAGPWSKPYVRPVLWLATRRYLRHLAPDAEIRRKLSLFVRSKWFRPPFDGATLCRMYDTALRGMGGNGGSSLVPDGHRLSLMLTATDYHGHPETLSLHDPATIEEREHRHLFEFDYLRRPTGACRTDLDAAGLPGLVFAARASSSFPGAFPAATLAELEGALEADWPRRAAFLARNFAPYAALGAAVSEVCFIDGSVLNNKPFAAAIKAIGGRPAYREVDRRLVYIDPHPPDKNGESVRRAPRFIEVLVSALSELPRTQPIRDDLGFVQRRNARIQRMKEMIASARPTIAATVAGIVRERVTDKLGYRFSTKSGPHAAAQKRLNRWVDTAHAQVAQEVGLVHGGYIALKRGAVIEDTTALVGRLCDAAPDTPGHRRIAAEVAAWAARLPTEPGDVVAFFQRFDHAYRDRRLRFLIRGLNQLYAPVNQGQVRRVDASDLDRLKAALYRALDSHGARAPTRFAPPEVAARFRAWADGLELDASPAPENAAFDALMEGLAEARALPALTTEVETVLADDPIIRRVPQVRRALLTDYIGYPFWDVLLYSFTGWHSVGEFDEVRIDRISPDDAQSLRRGGARATLKGIQFAKFGAFFSRRYRENDYLWGRLHAVERLIDIVASAAPEAALTATDLHGFKQAAFRAIIGGERGGLTALTDEFERLDAELRAFGAKPSQSAPGRH